MPQYQGIWNLAQQAQAVVSQQWGTDPLFDYTTLLLQGDNTSSSSQNNVFVDSSTNNFLITRNGNTTQGSFSPFSQQPGYWSAYFGGSGNYASSSSAVISATTSTFTIEGWVYQTAATVGATIPSIIGDMSPTSFSAYWSFGTLASGALSFYWYDGSNGLSAVTTTTVPLNTWVHIAVSVNSNAISMYINGVQQSLTGNTTLTNRGGTNTLTTFAQFSAGTTGLYTGYISNFSVLSGTAKYSGSFTPSTTPLPTGATNQTLLFAAGNQFADFNTATTAKTFTITGSATSVQAFSPFAPQYQYTPTVTGGSGYFDGTLDYLSLAATSAVVATGDFTIEAWVYCRANNAYQGIISTRTVGNNNGYGITVSNTGFLEFFCNNQSNSANAVPLNQWAHVAISRSGTATNNISFYLNGNRVGQGTETGTTLNDVLVIGRYYNNSTDQYHLNGYLSGVRVIIGSSIYSGATITIPTAPPTAVTNTRLLLNFTNAGILDGTMKNNLETVADAQVTTGAVKYGSGSMYFDGTGDWLTSYNPGGLYTLGTIYTVELWFNTRTTAAGTAGLVNLAINASTNNTGLNIYRSSAEIICDDGLTASTGPRSGASAIVANTWYHLAIVSNGVTTKLYLDGVERGSYTGTTGSANAMTYITVGAFNTKASPFNGYIDDLRITKGIARYTRNFTPPQVALPRQ